MSAVTVDKLGDLVKLTNDDNGHVTLMTPDEALELASAICRVLNVHPDSL